MEGVFVNKLNDEQNAPKTISEGIRLLAKSDDMEVMEQSFVEGSVVWLSPADDPNTMEFFLIISGNIKLELETEALFLGSGDYMTLKGLKKDIIVKTISDTRMIYVSNRPIFSETKDFETYFKTLITQIDDKDHYTCRHSMNVMNYSLAVYEELNGRNKDEKPGDHSSQLKDLIVASLFHDVGKCFTPDDILKKKDRLEPKEMRAIRHHPIDSGRLLRKYYNDRIAEIAENHHERMDGSGYPYGLYGDEISMEAKILAVVDAFDAMTTARGYNDVKTFAQAAEELVNLPHLFDHDSASALQRLVAQGQIPGERIDADG